MHRKEMWRETFKFFLLGNFRYNAELINLETQNINVKLTSFWISKVRLQSIST